MARRSRKQRNPGGSTLARLGPLLLPFLAGGLVVFLLMGGFAHLRLPLREAPVVPNAALHAQQRLTALEAVLLPQAEWHHRELDPPLEWLGRLPSSQSLVQWNARVSAGIRALGMEVLEGQEDIIERPGSWPLQRLTLVVGEAGEMLATIVVETTRSPETPMPF